MTPTETARLLLAVGGRCLWAELRQAATATQDRHPLPLPTMFRDVHCERLLLGCCLAGGQLCAARATMAGLRKHHFSEPGYRDLWATLGTWPLSSAGLLQRLDLITTYLDAEHVVNEDRWAAAIADGVPQPTLSFIACDVAAEGLAGRIVMLGEVRQKLREAEQLLNGSYVRQGKGATGL